MRMLVSVLLALTPVISNAQSKMPYYDPQAVCDHLNNFGGNPSHSILEQCLNNEQEGYDSVKARLTTTPPESMRVCRRMTEFGGFPSYSMLDECLKQEARSQSSASSFQFKR